VPLTDWLQALITTPLPLPGGAACALTEPATLSPELEFWLSAGRVDTRELDRLVCEHTLDAALRPALEPAQLQGMLKGFIDLVFEHEGRYYVIDYKSNWLGADEAAYTPEAMRAAILEARYELQYVLYLFALHRQLRARLPGYDYDRHIGGAAYVFLRGVGAESRGVHVERPPRELIEALDELFSAQVAA
jgi:exodeoxyribonuclease V beta subunit